MPEYDAQNFDPPAPVAFVTLRNPATGVMLPDVPMLIDTGADATLLPTEAVHKIGVEIEADLGFEVKMALRRPGEVSEDQDESLDHQSGLAIYNDLSHHLCHYQPEALGHPWFPPTDVANLYYRIQYLNF